MIFMRDISSLMIPVKAAMDSPGGARVTERKEDSSKCTCGSIAVIILILLLVCGLSVATAALSLFYPAWLSWYRDFNERIKCLEDRIEQLNSTGKDNNTAKMIADLYEEIRTNFSIVRDDLLERIDAYSAIDVNTNNQSLSSSALFSRVDQLENQTLAEVRRFSHNLQAYEVFVNRSLQDLEISGNETRSTVERGQSTIVQNQHDFELHVNESLHEVNTSNSETMRLLRRNTVGLENLTEIQHSFSIFVNDSLLELSSSAAETRSLAETNHNNLQLAHQNFTDRLMSAGNEISRFINSSIAEVREQVDTEISDVREQIQLVRQFTNVGLLNVSYTLEALDTEIRANVKTAIDDVRNTDIVQLQNGVNTNISTLEEEANRNIMRLMKSIDALDEKLRSVNETVMSGSDTLRSIGVPTLVMIAIGFKLLT